MCPQTHTCAHCARWSVHTQVSKLRRTERVRFGQCVSVPDRTCVLVFVCTKKVQENLIVFYQCDFKWLVKDTLCAPKLQQPLYFPASGQIWFCFCILNPIVWTKKIDAFITSSNLGFGSMLMPFIWCCCRCPFCNSVLTFTFIQQFGPNTITFGIAPLLLPFFLFTFHVLTSIWKMCHVQTQPKENINFLVEYFY